MDSLLQMIDLEQAPEPWSEGDNIPWNDPDFSGRMLREHLTQDHGGASRRSETIDAQVAWIDGQLLEGPTSILDLGCGPGLYTQRLAARGHSCVGIDYSPASIEHARQAASAAEAACTYLCEDIRAAEFGTGYGLVTILYGEINVFRPEDVDALLSKAAEALAPGGWLLLEPSTAAAVESFGRAPRHWSTKREGLFSASPHLYMTESHWDPGHGAATRRYFVVDAQSGSVSRYAQTLKAWAEGELVERLQRQGFEDVQVLPRLGRDGDAAIDLYAMLARRRG